MLRNLSDIKGFTLAATDGEIGTVREIYFDDKTWQVRYLVVAAGPWIADREVLIAPRALGTVDIERGLIGVDLTKAQVENSPPIEAHKPVSRQYEQLYYDHYGWIPYWLDAGNIPGAMVTPMILPTPGQFAPEPKPKELGDPRLRSSEEVGAYEIRAQDDEVGHVEDFIVDNKTWRIRYLVVVTRNWFPGKTVLLSPDWIEEISYEQNRVFVTLASSTIKTAPEYNPKEPITREIERQLHDHYGHKAYWDEVAELHRK